MKRKMCEGLLVSGDELKSRFHEVFNIPHENKIGEVVITKIHQIPEYLKKEVTAAGWHTL